LNVLLIGPMVVGKSSISSFFSCETLMPSRFVDEMVFDVVFYLKSNFFFLDRNLKKRFFHDVHCVKKNMKLNKKFINIECYELFCDFSLIVNECDFELMAQRIRDVLETDFNLKFNF